MAIFDPRSSIPVTITILDPRSSITVTITIADHDLDPDYDPTIR